MTELADRKSPASPTSLALWIVSGLFSLVLLYALSPLPAWWLYLRLATEHDNEIVGWFMWFFWPISWLADRSTTVDQFYEWYLSPLN